MTALPESFPDARAALATALFFDWLRGACLRRYQRLHKAGLVLESRAALRMAGFAEHQRDEAAAHAGLIGCNLPDRGEIGR